MRFWDLPGPAAFLEGVREQLAWGKTVVVGLPAIAPPAIASVLREYLLRESWSALPVLRATADPMEGLASQLGLQLRGPRQRDVAVLFEELLDGEVLIVDEVTQEILPRWREFLAAFESASRAVPGMGRPYLVCLLRGFDAASYPRPAPALSLQTWDGVVNELDMLAYAGSRVRSMDLSGYSGLLFASTVCKLALWDADLAEHLLSIPAREIFEPEPFLRAYAQERGWTSLTKPSWQDGSSAMIDGHRRVHSALLAVTGGTGELAMRVWSSQAAQLLPLVELHRRQIVSTVRHKLVMPVQVGEEKITDPYQLEVGTLAYIAKPRGFDRKIVSRLYKLRDLRNKLAHLEVVAAEEAFDPELGELGQ